MGGGTPPTAASEGGCGGGADPAGPITLAVPRPEHERARNVYVDIPFQHKVAPRAASSSPHDLPPVHGAAHRRSHAKAPPPPAPPQKRTPVVASQPTPSLTFTKGGPEEDSILCSRCGRCRCEACAGPRPPAGAWACGGKCRVSAAAAVDYLSCLCCVSGVLYHCAKDPGDGSGPADRPCACSGGDVCPRWACLALAALPLPCLVCYWPLRGAKALFEKTYDRFTTQGCRCRPSPDPPRRMEPLPVPPPEKRLLHDCA